MLRIRGILARKIVQRKGLRSLPMGLTDSCDPHHILEVNRAWTRAVAAEQDAERQTGMSGSGAEAWLEVADLYAKVEALLPDDHRLATNRGNALWIAERPQEALKAYRRAVELAPNDPVVYRGLGNVYVDNQAFEAAERAYRRSLELEPAALTYWNLSQLLIGLERYAEGYVMAEERWQLPKVDAWRDPSSAWAGDLDDRCEPLLVWSEQGLGDTLQHLRWLGPLVRRRGRRAKPLVLEVEPCLVRLLELGLSHLEPRPHVRAKPPGGPAPWSGAHLSLLSLPRLLGEAPLPKGYSKLDAPTWAKPRTVPMAPEPWRVGLVWGAGRKLDDPITAREYRRRSLDSESLGMLIVGLAARGFACTLLQFGCDREMALPWRDRVTSELPADADFASTASVVAGLDLVITVDTAMAHLVGAMGRVGWLLLPVSAAPRWLRKRRDTPWYPNLRLFRQQKPGEWSDVVIEVLKELDNLRQTGSFIETSL